MLLLLLATRPSQAEEPKFFLEKNLDKAHDILRAGFEGCTLQMQISFTRKVSEAIEVEIDLRKIDAASISLDEQMGLSLAARGEATPVTIRAGDNTHSESRYRIYVGDADLASKLADNLARVVGICNLYDCPGGKLCPEDSAGGSEVPQVEEKRAAPAPRLGREEIDAALPFDAELVEEVMSQLDRRREEGESVIRRLPSLSSEERDALRERYGLVRRSAMTREETAFNRAVEGARHGKPELVLEYLRHGGKVDHPATDREYRLSGTTLLINAVRGNHPQIVRLLLGKGADVNLPGDSNILPIETAADDDRLEILKELIDHGARLGRSKRENTPLWIAAMSGEVGAIKLLISHGANPNELGSYDEPPLSRAAGNGYTEAVRALLAGGARINATDKDGTTALHSAILGSLEVVQLLVEHGADVNQVDGEGKTPLDRASELHRYETVNYLRSHGALSTVDLWVTTRPPTAPPIPHSRTLRVPCAEGTRTEGLASLWDDPEYQSFLKRLRPWIPPLEPGETSSPTADLVTVGWSAMAEFIQEVLPALAQGDLEKIEVDAPGFVKGSRKMLAISGYLLSEKDRMAELSGDQVFTAAAMLQIGLVPTFNSEQKTLDYERARELYDLVLTASDLFNTLIPCDALSTDDQMIAGLLSQVIAITTPPVKPRDAGPPMARDLERLRERLRPWLGRVGVDAQAYSILGSGLLGHASAGQADALLKLDKGKLPYLVLFYRPEDYRGKPFSCTPFEESVVGHNACTREEVEVGLLAKLMVDASNTGEHLDERRRYESFFILSFLTRHYGDLMEQHSPGLRAQFIRWASDFVKSIDMIDRPDSELSPTELLVKEIAIKQFRDPRRARELYVDFKDLFSD